MAIREQRTACAMETAERPKHRTMMVLVICAAVYAAYLPAALWLRHTYVPMQQPPGEMVELLGNIRHIEGFGYQAPTPFLLTYADTDLGNQRSPLVLYENSTPLGPPHSSHADIQENRPRPVFPLERQPGLRVAVD